MQNVGDTAAQPHSEPTSDEDFADLYAVPHKDANETKLMENELYDTNKTQKVEKRDDNRSSNTASTQAQSEDVADLYAVPHKDKTKTKMVDNDLYASP